MVLYAIPYIAIISINVLGTYGTFGSSLIIKITYKNKPPFLSSDVMCVVRTGGYWDWSWTRTIMPCLWHSQVA